MAGILYVETNFLLSIATGRDPQAQTLIQNFPTSVSLAIPSICCMESLSAFEDELKRRNSLTNILDLQISESRRDGTSPHAQILLRQLEEARVSNQNLLNDVRSRLSTTHIQLANLADLIQLTPEALLQSINNNLTRDPTDNLILHSIYFHAEAHANVQKALLTGDNHLREVAREFLQRVGVSSFFSRAQDFIGWWQSQLSEDQS